VKLEIQDIIDHLRIELNNPLPGKSAYSRVLPPDRPLESPSGITTINQAGVLLLLFPDKGKLNTVFIRRPSFMKNHAGQIAFPGGQFEPNDKDIVETALREAAEEIGINSGQVEIIGRLSALYVKVSNFCILPLIGWNPIIPSFRFDTNEVTGIHIIPVDDLLNPGTIQNQKVDTSHGFSEFPGYLVDDVFIWGATAMILSEFIEVYRKIKKSGVAG
jgi:8-oxo-dGTP pyrophosphatase MutT (NUDIX family)